MKHLQTTDRPAAQSSSSCSSGWEQKPHLRFVSLFISTTSSYVVGKFFNPTWTSPVSPLRLSGTAQCSTLKTRSCCVLDGTRAEPSQGSGRRMQQQYAATWQKTPKHLIILLFMIQGSQNSSWRWSLMNWPALKRVWHYRKRLSGWITSYNSGTPVHCSIWSSYFIHDFFLNYSFLSETCCCSSRWALCMISVTLELGIVLCNKGVLVCIHSRPHR